MRYRQSGDRSSHVGRTENINPRGIVIRTCDVTIPPLTPIEILRRAVRTEPPQQDASDAPTGASIVEDVAPLVEHEADVAATDPRRI